MIRLEAVSCGCVGRIPAGEHLRVTGFLIEWSGWGLLVGSLADVPSIISLRAEALTLACQKAPTASMTCCSRRMRRACLRYDMIPLP